MSVKEKKLAVLQQLTPTPVSLPELLGKLDANYSERTLRRWLAEMVAEGLVEKLGHKRATKYYLPKTQAETTSTSIFSTESVKIIEQVRRPLYSRMPVIYNEVWLDSYQPGSTYYIPEHIRTKLLEAGKRSKSQEPAGTYAHQIFNRLLIDLSYNSSRLEGNTYSLLDTQRLVLEGASAEGKLDEEKIMILNHKEAIRYLVDNAPRLRVDLETIFTLHYLLSDGLLEAHQAGRIRKEGVRIGGSTYIPFEDSKRLQLQLELITQKAILIDDPYEQSLFLLIHISYLQAFSDVNKRTARLCANIPLIKNNLVPLSFNDVPQSDYTSAMIAIYELQQVKPLLDLYLFSYLRTCHLYDSTAKMVGFDEVRVRYRQQRRALLREIILGQIAGATIESFIQMRLPPAIKDEDREAFLEDLKEDLSEIDLSRIAGLGVTATQLESWLNLT